MDAIPLTTSTADRLIPADQKVLRAWGDAAIAASDIEPPSLSDTATSIEPTSETDAITREYVKSTLKDPKNTINNPEARANFVDALLGNSQLARDAENDADLLKQLERRVKILCVEISIVTKDANDFATDAYIALLALVACRWHILLDVMEKEGVVFVVVSSMKTWRNRTSIVARCMTALRAFAVTDLMRKRVMFENGMDLTLELMQEYINDKRIQDRGTALIANVAFGCTHRKRRITREGGVNRIVKSMTKFPNDENIQLRGALTIRNLTYEAQVNQFIAGQQGAVEAIASTLLRFRGGSINPELRFQCVMALESLCRDDERNRERLLEVDNIYIRNTLIKKESDCSAVTSKPSDEEFEENINEDGDVVVEEEQVLISDVSPNFEHGRVLCPGRTSAALIASPSISSSCSDRNTCQFLTDENRPDHQQLPTSEAELQDMNVNKSEERPSVIRSILHAMRRDPGDCLLLETAMSLLTLLALHMSEAQFRIGTLGGIQIAIAGMKRHPQNSVLATKACALIRCLCFHELNRSQITSGLPVLIATARDHCRDPNVSREVASALSNAVFEHEKNRAWVVNKGGVGAMVHAINACGDKDVMVLEAGMCALRNFVDASFSGATIAANEGAIKAAVTALNMTKDAKTKGQQIVQEQAVLFLVDEANIAPKTKEEMRDIEVADWIENALAKLPIEKYPNLHKSGDELITMLNEPAKKFTVLPNRKNGTKPASGNSIFSKGFFSGLMQSRRQRKRHSVGKSMPISGDGTRRNRRRSGRTMNTTSIS